MMPLNQAIAIVIDLATENALDPKSCDKGLREEASKQQEALKIVTEAFLESLRTKHGESEVFARPFSTTGEMKIPLHAVCWPSAYMTIQDLKGRTVLTVPAVMEKDPASPDRLIANKEKTLALTIQIVGMLNMSGAQA